MFRRKPTLAPVKLLAVFFAISAALLGALGWLGWHTLEREESQRERARLENAAGLVARELDQGLASWEGLLTGESQPDAPLPLGSAMLIFDSRGVVEHRGAPVLYYPVASPHSAAGSDELSAAESLELRKGELGQAAAAYRRIASVNGRSVRPAALLGLARCLRKLGRIQEALAVYTELASLGGALAAGDPAELVAHRERSVLLQSAGDQPGSRSESDLILAALDQGRFPLDRVTFDFYRGSAPVPRSAATVLAQAVEALWPLWQQQSSGRSAWNADGKDCVAVWKSGRALIAPSDAVIAPLAPALRSLQVSLALSEQPGGISRTSRETGLPWTISVSSTPAAQPAPASRRSLLQAGFGIVTLVILAAGYFAFRSVTKELSVARLQSDFVSAVSHEFRTPLTAMRHLTEMLEEDTAPPERLPQYYRALGKETRRLQEMVENLLDFGRMEAGKRTYRMAGESACDLAAKVVSEFRDRAGFAPERVTLHTSPETLQVQADREALSLAIRNLLDNAIKYSPESSHVNVSVKRRGDFAEISVQDHGTGIARREHQAVFGKFVRGASAREFNVKGTGIGLAMTDQIVTAHGGRVELESELGRGSTFTILLPAQHSPS